jgi:hypothetical protein
MALGPLGLIDPEDPPLSLADPAIQLAEEYLTVPTGSGAGGRLVLTGEQVEFLILWYSVDPSGRRFAYRRGMLRMSKGWAKSPIGAVIAFNELVGECVPDGLDADGLPVGRPHPAPWVQIAATSEDQTDNLYGQLFDMLRDSDAVDDLGLDLGITRTMLKDRPGRIEPVTSAAGSREGQPISAALLEETHLWKNSNGGRALAAVLNRNAAKMGARTLQLTNAYAPGAGSVAERTEESIRKGAVPGSLLVVREAPTVELDDRDGLRRALAYVYGQAARDRGGWVDLDRLVEEAADTEPSEYRRFYLNQIVAPEEAPVDLVAWADLEREGAALAEGDTIALGFDGSESGDATALYAVRWPDWLIVPIGVWEPPVDEHGHTSKGWRVPRREVVEKIRETCQRYRVVRGYADDAGWQSELDEIAAEFGEALMRFPHRSDSRIGPACERFSTMAREGVLGHTGDPVLVRHMANARKVMLGREGSTWWRPARRVEGHPIDALSAVVSAVHALGDAVARGLTGAEEEPPAEPMFAFT